VILIVLKNVKKPDSIFLASVCFLVFAKKERRARIKKMEGTNGPDPLAAATQCITCCPWCGESPNLQAPMFIMVYGVN
jgi:hypothetical protein